MCSKQNRKLKSKLVQHDYRNKWIGKINKAYICECKCRFFGRKYNSDQWWNNDKCQCECRKGHLCDEHYICIPATCSYEYRKYLAGIMDDSAMMCDEIIELDNEETNFNEKKAAYKAQKLYILLALLLTTVALMIAASI